MNTDTPSDRYRALVHWLRDEYRGARGWQSLAAKRLGVHQATLSKLISGERLTIGLDAIETAIERLPIDRRYFFAPKDELGFEWSPAAFMLSTDAPRAQPHSAMDPRHEERFWMQLGTRVGSIPKVANIREPHRDEKLEIHAGMMRDCAHLFANHFPLTVEARRLSKASVEELETAWDGFAERVRILLRTFAPQEELPDYVPPEAKPKGKSKPVSKRSHRKA